MLPIVDALPVRSIGPTAMGGRITSLAVYEREPRIFYAGAAAGGVWKTQNGGITFKPVFEHEGSSSIGAVAVSQSNPNVVWVGTGEGTKKSDVEWGDGIYKSVDGGKTWKNMGLRQTGSFSKIVIDPQNSNIVVAAALGHTWGYNPERGLYRSTDAGATWKQVLYVDERTGAADLVADPKNPRNML